MMSEKHLKLKLKRKKSAIQGDKCEQNSTVTVKKNTGVPIPFSSSESDRRSEATGDPYDSKPGVWWDRPDLQAVEELWAAALKSAIPNLGHHVWETVPDLPLASPAACSVEEQTGWRWCSLSEEVGPLPSPPKPPAGSSAVPGGRGPPHPLLLPETSPETPPNPGQRPSPAPPEEGAGEGRSARTPGPPVRRAGKATGRHPRSPPSSREVLAGASGRGEREQKRAAGRDSLAGAGRDSLAGAGSDSLAGAGRDSLAGAGRDSLAGAGRDWLAGAGRDSLAGAGRDSLAGAGRGGAGGGVIRPPLPVREEAGGSNSGALVEQHRRAEFPTGPGDVSGNAEAHRNSAGGAAVAMESCPMCLRPFPAGSTQMECDSHLAKCLSEMGDDITW